MNVQIFKKGTHVHMHTNISKHDVQAPSHCIAHTLRGRASNASLNPQGYLHGQ